MALKADGSRSLKLSSTLNVITKAGRKVFLITNHDINVFSDFAIDFLSLLLPANSFQRWAIVEVSCNRAILLGRLSA